MDSSHSAYANMKELLLRGWDDKADEIINIDFEEVLEETTQVIPFR